MLFAAYTSPGHGAVDWLTDKTFDPGALDFIQKINKISEIPWSDMFLTIVQLGTYGLCGMVLCQALGMKEIGKMCMWVTVVDCFAVVIKGLTG